MHLAIFLGEYPITAQSSFSFKMRCLMVLETLKNIDFQGGIPTFKNENEA